MLVKLAWREIRNNRSFSLFFAFNLSLGILGLITVDAFRNSVEQRYERSSREILGADVVVSARRPLKEEEQSQIQKLAGEGFQSSKIIEFYSMIRHGQGSRLTFLQAIDENFPFYGGFQFRQPQTDSSNRDVLENNHVWVYSELLSQLGVQVGSKLKIGKAEFQITREIVYDSSNSMDRLNLAPKIVIGKTRLKQTELLEIGQSLVWNSWMIQLPQGKPIEELANQIDQQLGDPAVRVWTPKSTSTQLNRVSGYFSDYLGLISLTALFLASFGASYLFRNYFRKRIKEMAILRSLGFSPGQTEAVFLVQVTLLGLLTILPVLAFSDWLLPLLSQLFRDSLANIQISPEIGWQSVAVTLAVAILGSWFICLPTITECRKIKPNQLLADRQSPSATSLGSRLAWYLPLIALYWGLAIWQAHSFRIGSFFMVTVLACTILLAFVASLLLKGLRRFESLGIHAKLALRNLRRSSLSTISSFLALGLGCTLLNLVPQLQNLIENELSFSSSQPPPSLFLFDIQEEQAEQYLSALKELGVSEPSLSPMVRARLAKVNNVPFEKLQRDRNNFTREQESEQRFRNRGFNLSYRSKLSDSERVVRGEDFLRPSSKSKTLSNDGSSHPRISLERRFARRLGLEIGDILEFDIAGVFVTGQVVNLRNIRWTSFTPNFFILFEPGVLEEAPKTFVSAISKISQTDLKQKIQKNLVEKLPNISIVDVDRVVERLISVISQMSWGLQLMSFLSLLAGFVVLYSITNFQAYSRAREVNLMKVLGGQTSQVRKVFFIESIFISVGATLFGSLSSLAVSAVIAEVIFDNQLEISWMPLILIFTFLVSLGALVGDFSTRGVLKQKPLQLLKEAT